MNRTVFVFAILASVFGAVVCQAQVQKKVTVKPEKILIAYFSHSGNTRFVAEQIQKQTGGTLFEIQPVKAYPGDYTKCVNRSKEEISKGIRPELKNKVPDIKKYDVIFVGSPNWWSTVAPPVATFLVVHDLTGKKVVPFVTHGGAGISHSEEDVRKLCPKSQILEYGSFTGSRVRQSGKAVQKFVQDRLVIQK